MILSDEVLLDEELEEEYFGPQEEKHQQNKPLTDEEAEKYGIAESATEDASPLFKPMGTEPVLSREEMQTYLGIGDKKAYYVTDGQLLRAMQETTYFPDESRKLNRFAAFFSAEEKENLMGLKSNVSIQTPDIWLKPANSTGSAQWFRFPLNPDKLSIKTGAKTLSFSVLALGEVKIPKGSKLVSYSWSSNFPNESTTYELGLIEYSDPKEIVKSIEGWQTSGQTLSLIITQLGVTKDVFVESFNYKWQGLNECSYTITLTERKPIMVTTYIPPSVTEEARDFLTTINVELGKTKNAKTKYYDKYSWKGKKGKKLGTIKEKGTWLVILECYNSYYRFYELADSSRQTILDTIRAHQGDTTKTWISKKAVKKDKNPTPLQTDAVLVSTMYAYNENTVSDSGDESLNTYTVQTGDSLYSIAMKVLGDGTRYEEIYELNQKVIDTLNKESGGTYSRYNIFVGTVLMVPKRWS